MMFAVRWQATKEFYAIVPVTLRGAKKNDVELGEALLFDALDEIFNPFQMEFCRLKSSGGWKFPDEEWKPFRKTVGEYHTILKGE